jgi:type I restriction enzyme S subunit
LDQAEALRAKRRHALAQLDTLIQSIFLDLFGDPATNAKGWSTAFLNDLLAMPLRNGLSPSNSGGVKAKVLTLSAITGDAFRADAWKEAPFQSIPPLDQRVDAADLLICRGNGNARLVGKGYFPPCDMLALTFPDTMIAARVSGDRVAPDFLQVLWNGSSIRRQIESLARTTNGTFKINQTMLESIRLIAPPLPLQREFAAQVSAVERLKAAQRASLAKLDALFASLQHRSFRGEI